MARGRTSASWAAAESKWPSTTDCNAQVTGATTSRNDGSAWASEVVRSADRPTASDAAARVSAECRAANAVGGVISQPSGAESQTSLLGSSPSHASVTCRRHSSAPLSTSAREPVTSGGASSRLVAAPDRVGVALHQLVQGGVPGEV